MTDRKYPYSPYYHDDRSLCERWVEFSRKKFKGGMERAIGGPLASAVLNAITISDLDMESAIVEPDEDTNEPTMGVCFNATRKSLRDIQGEIEHYRRLLGSLSARLKLQLEKMQEAEEVAMEEFQRKSREEDDEDDYNYAASDFAYDAARESRAFPSRD